MLCITVFQAPESMKSVMQAVWLLTTAFGDVIVVIVAGVKLFSQVAVYLQQLYSLKPHLRSGVVRIDPLHFLARCRTWRLNQV